MDKSSRRIITVDLNKERDYYIEYQIVIEVKNDYRGLESGYDLKPDGTNW